MSVWRVGSPNMLFLYLYEAHYPRIDQHFFKVFLGSLKIGLPPCLGTFSERPLAERLVRQIQEGFCDHPLTLVHVRERKEWR